MFRALACLFVVLLAGRAWAQASESPTLVLRYEPFFRAFVVENINTGEMRQMTPFVESYSTSGELSPTQRWFAWRETLGLQATSRILRISRVGGDTSILLLDEAQEGGGPYAWSPFEDILLLAYGSYGENPVKEGFRLYNPYSDHVIEDYRAYTSPAWTPDGQGVTARKYFVNAARTFSRRLNWVYLHHFYPVYETQRVYMPYLGTGRLGELQVIDVNPVTTCFDSSPSVWWLDSQIFVSLSRNEAGQQGMSWKNLETGKTQFIAVPEILESIDFVIWNPQMTHAIIHFTNSCDPFGASPQLGLVSLIDGSFHLVVAAADSPPQFAPGFYGDIGGRPHYTWLNDGTKFVVYYQKRFQIYDVKTQIFTSLPIPQPEQPLYAHHSEPDNVSIVVSPNSQTIFVVWSGEVWRYDTATHETTLLSRGIDQIRVSPNGDFLSLKPAQDVESSSCEDAICILDTATNQVIASLAAPHDDQSRCIPVGGISAEWDPTSQWVAIFNSQLECLDVYAVTNISSTHRSDMTGFCTIYNGCFVWLPAKTPFDRRWGEIVVIPPTLP